MIEKTRVENLPNGDAPDMAVAVMNRLRDTRIEEGAACANCRFAFPIKLDLKTAGLECRGAPPTMGYAVLGDNLGRPVGMNPLGIVPRIVPANYFCGTFQSAPKES